MLQLSLLIFCYNPSPNPSSQGRSQSLPALSKQVVMKKHPDYCTFSGKLTSYPSHANRCRTVLTQGQSIWVLPKSYELAYHRNFAKEIINMNYTNKILSLIKYEYEKFKGNQQLVVRLDIEGHREES